MKTLKLQLFAFLSSCLLCSAEVTPIQIRLVASIQGTFSYSVPVGKTLIIEQFIFNNSWKDSGDDMEILIRHEGVSTAGAVFDTTQRYTSAINSLLRPIKLPSQKGISVKNLNNTSYRCYVYGLLVDNSDLFASNFKSVEQPKIAGSGNARTFDGITTLKTNRPSKVTLESSTNLRDWATVSTTTGTSVEVPFSIAAPENTPKTFVRASVVSRPSELLAPFPRFIFIPGPFNGS